MDAPNTIALAGAGGALLLLLLLFSRRRARPGEGTYVTPGASRLVRAGKYADAARLALDAKNFEEAMDLFLQARDPAQAARAAARGGMKKKAAELFEFAGDKKAAAHYYDQAGMQQRADELRAAGGLAMADALPPPGPPSARAQTGFLAPPPMQTADMLARPDPDAEALANKTPRERADLLLARGDVRGAAEALRDGKFIEEAVYLYVNVLGEPQSAAPLVAELGNHDRAAELFELAGDGARAAVEWARAALKAGKPLTYLERIENLDPVHATEFLKKATESQPLSKDNADLHYELARLYSRQGQLEAALQRFQDLITRFGSYRDAEQQVLTLRGGQPGPATTQSAPRAKTSQLGPVKPARLSPEQLETLVTQAATAAAQQIRAHTLDDLFAQTPSTSRPAATIAVTVQGLERSPLDPNLIDGAALMAKNGPNVESLLKFVHGRECDLQNIEVYYRLGLAYLARGNWQAAEKAFDAVEECSPGYRDGWKRADGIRQWQHAIHHTKIRPNNEGGWAQRYELMGELGRGGMAVVYRARDRVLERDVAMKFMSEHLQGNDLAELFTREAKAVAALNHPNIVTIYDFGTFEGRLFICMEYIEGKTTENLLDDKSLTIVDSLRILKQTLAGLEYAHQNHIVHRDIKPANLMRLTDGRVKIMDFGLAKATRDQKKSSMIAGTPAYMPPEQLEGRELDHRADLFAVGVTMYELLTHSLPFEGMDRNRTPARISQLVPTIPELLDATAARALALDPADRFASAAEMLEPIAAVLAAVQQYAARPPAKQERAATILGTAATVILPHTGAAPRS